MRHPPKRGGGGAVGSRGIYASLGAAASGLLLSSEDVGEFWDDFLQAASATVLPGWFPDVAGTGALATNGISGMGGGVVRLTSGATAASREAILALMGQIPPGLDTQRFYQAMRFKVSSAITAQTIAAMGFRNQANTKTVAIGVFGAGGTTNFLVQHNGDVAGSFVDTGVPVDTNFHVFELWGVGDGKIHSRIDGGGTDVNTTMVAPPTDYTYAYGTVRNGTDAVARTLDIDWVYTLFPRI